METTKMSNNDQTSITAYVAYKDLMPCRNAFVDTRTPGSDQKENFTIIGPGVSENPNQHVHIPVAHGFNIGGARQPSGCLNSQHSHETAEVFIVQDGRWKFTWGVEGKDGSVVLEKGDVISIPTKMFRGFENITEGGGSHFLFAVLGGDDPGFVTWAPSVFRLAKKYGLILTESGRLIDTTQGEKMREGESLQQPPSAEMLKQLASPENEAMAKCILRYQQMQPNAESALASSDVEESAVIVPTATADGFVEGPIKGWWPHGFNLRRIKINAGGKTKPFIRHEEEVLLMHDGNLTVEVGAQKQKFQLSAGDVLTIKIGEARRFISDTGASFFVVRGGDSPQELTFV